MLDLFYQGSQVKLNLLSQFRTGKSDEDSTKVEAKVEASLGLRWPLKKLDQTKN